MKKIILLFSLLTIGFTSNAVTYTVTSTANGTNTDGVSLRWAITQANTGVGNTIAFNIPGMAPHTITLTSALPTLSKDNITIDGSTQPANGYTGANPKIIINGNNAISKGIEASPTKDDMKIYGLYIKGFTDYAIYFPGKETHIIGAVGKGNVISGNGNASTDAAIYVKGAIIKANIIGLDASGTTAQANTGYGIQASGGVCIIGGANAGEGNVISKNTNHGIYFTNCDNSIIKGNKIGTDINGANALGNGGNGIYITVNSNNVEIGGTTQAEANVISGNTLSGINNDGGNDLIVKGNKIGTDITGTLNIGNTGNGITLTSTATMGTIEANVISGNASGIYISGADNGIIKNNKIGTDITGTQSISNTDYGIFITNNADSHQIGGTGTNEGNIIAYNGNSGVGIDANGGILTDNNKIQRNSIFCNDTAYKGIHLINNGNDGMAKPVITIIDASGIHGTAQANATIELFYADTCYFTEGYTYIASVVANGSGNWNYAIPHTGFLTATATLAAHGTSEFSGPVALEGPRGACPSTYCTKLANSDFSDFYLSGNSINDLSPMGGECSSSNIPEPGNVDCWRGSHGTPHLTLINGAAYNKASWVSQVCMFSLNDGRSDGIIQDQIIVKDHIYIYNYDYRVYNPATVLSPNIFQTYKQTVTNFGALDNLKVKFITKGSTFCKSLGSTSSEIPSLPAAFQQIDQLTNVAPMASYANRIGCIKADNNYDAFWFNPQQNTGAAFNSQVCVDNVQMYEAWAGDDVAIACGETIIGAGCPTIPNVTYSWSPTNGLSNPSILNPTVNGSSLTAGPHIYTLTITTVSGCSSSDEVIITVDPKPTINVGADVIVCSGACASLSATAGSGTLPFTYLWSTGQTTSAITVCPIVNTTYTVIATTNNGCSATDEVVVTVIPSPTVDAGNDVVICLGGSTQLNATSPTGGLSYSWSPIAGIVSGGNTPNPIVAPTSTTTYTITVTIAGMCSFTDAVIVTVGLPPTIDQVFYDICLSSCVNITTTVSGGTVPYMYLWNTGQTSSTINVCPAITTDYTVTVTDGAGCSAAGLVSVNVIQATINVGPDRAICEGESIVLTNSNSGTSSWQPTTGLTFSGGGNNIVTANPTTTITYTVNTTFPFGCIATDEVTVFVSPNPTVNVGPDQTACSGSCANLSASAGGGALPFNYLWSNGETSSTISVCPLSATSYTVTATSASGCTATDDILVTVNPTPTIAVQASPTTICPGQSTILIATDGFSTYSWTPAASLNNTTNRFVLATPLVTTTYVVVGTAANGCTATAQITITVGSSTILVNTTDQIICEGSCTNVTATASGGIPPYVYSWNTGQSTSSINVCPAVTTQYTVTVTGGCGATGSRDVEVEALPLPILTTYTVTSAGCDNDLKGTFTANGNDINGDSPFTYLWSTGATSLTLTGLNAGTYTLTITDANGCSANQIVTIGIQNPCPDTDDPLIEFQDCEIWIDCQFFYNLPAGTLFWFDIWPVATPSTAAVAYNLLPCNNPLAEYSNIRDNFDPLASHLYTNPLTDPADFANVNDIPANCETGQFRLGFIDIDNINNLNAPGANFYMKGATYKIRFHILDQNTGVWFHEDGCVPIGNSPDDCLGNRPNTGNGITPSKDDPTRAQQITIASLQGKSFKKEKLSSSEPLFTGSVNVYPNPNNGSMTFDYTLNAIGELQITDVMGRQIAAYSLKEGSHLLSVTENELRNGVYFYNIIINGQAVKTDRLVIIK